jgi:hypothetical protein
VSIHQGSTDTVIYATVTVDPYAATGSRDVTVTSQGWNGMGFYLAPASGQQATGNSSSVNVQPPVLASISMSPAGFYLSTGESRNITTSVTPSSASFNVSYQTVFYSNLHGSCAAGLEVNSVNGTGSVSSPAHKPSANSAECSGIYWVNATAQNSSSSIQSSQIQVVIPPQKLIQVVYGESHGQIGIGDYTSQIAIGTVIRNRFGDPAHFGGVTTYQAAITPSQFMGIATQITDGPTPELGHAAGIYGETLGTEVAGATCFFSPTHDGWVAIQGALYSFDTTLPTVAFNPGCYSSAAQFVVKSSIGNNADGRGAPAFILVRQRGNPATEPAVIQIP